MFGSQWHSAPLTVNTEPLYVSFFLPSADIEKICYSEISCPLFPYMAISVVVPPSRPVSEARAPTVAAAHRSLPYLEVSSTKTARRRGRREGGEGAGQGKAMNFLHPENRFCVPLLAECRSKQQNGGFLIIHHAIRVIINSIYSFAWNLY